jgi:hypothetical protein
VTVNVLAVDPGKTVGIACYSDGKFWSTQLPRADAMPYIAGLMEGFCGKQPGSLYVVVERFYQGRAGGPVRTTENDAIEVLAVIEQLCVERGLRHSRQSPSDAKNVCPDLWLRYVGWWQPGLDHANDAARHIKLVLMRKFKEEFVRVWRGDTIELNQVVEEEEDAVRGT